MTLAEIKSRWNEVLDALLIHDRLLWLALFDARLANYSDGVLTLDFSDPQKFASDHDFSAIRKIENIHTVETIIQNVLGISISLDIQ